MFTVTFVIVALDREGKCRTDPDRSSSIKRFLLAVISRRFIW